MRAFIIVLILSATIGTVSAQTAYHNLEKYWWYRYRLVNDFMYIDTTGIDSVGSSLPAQKRERQGTEFWAPPPGHFRHDSVGLEWQDCTVELGHYIGALALEYRILKDNHWDTERTKWELHHALKAFNRLDSNAETFSQDITRFPYNPVSWSTSFPLELNNNTVGPMNGFFLRDDVPFNPLLTGPAGTRKNPDLVSTHLEHFNRPGRFYNRDLLPFDNTLAVGSCVPSKYNAMTLAKAENSSNFTDYVRDCNFFPRVPTPPDWPTYCPHYPDEESQDQIADMFLGLSLATNLLDYGVTSTGGMDLRLTSADAAQRIVSWLPKPAMTPPWAEDWIPFITYHAPPAWLLKNPLTMRCVFCSYLTHYLSMDGCIASGAWGPESYCYSASRAVKKSVGHHFSAYEPFCTFLVGKSNFPSYYTAFQFQQVLHLEGTRDVEFSDIYTSVSGAWQLPLFPWPFTFLNPNSSWRALYKHARDEHFAEPHLPLVYRINFSLPGLGSWPTRLNTADYENLLNVAPECGPYHYSTSDYGDREWSGSDRLAEWFHREGFGYSGIGGNNTEWNGLDYMMLFNLYIYHMGSGYLDYLINPYYTKEFDVDYPDWSAGGLGSASYRLTLNWLEYISYKNTIHSDGYVEFRAAHVQEALPGFEAEYGSLFHAYIQDYTCYNQDGDSYHFALDNGSPTVYSPSHTTFVAKPYTHNDSLNAAMEDSISNILYSPDLYNSLLDSAKVYAQAHNINIDSLINIGMFNADGTVRDSDLIKGIISLDNGASTLNTVELYPNPTSFSTTVNIHLAQNSSLSISVLNAAGQEFNFVIAQYTSTQSAGEHNIVLHAEKLKPGIYFVKVSIGNNTVTKKLTVL